MKIAVEETVFTFDLDDTLYKEIYYKKSGLKAIKKFLSNLYEVNKIDELNKIIASDEDNPIDNICDLYGLNKNIKEALIWIYRLHVPDITLSEGNRSLISWLEKNSAGVFILTDGRTVTQRLKLKALGLEHIKSFISEEYDGFKPAPGRFIAIKNLHPDKNHVYIADNIQKDFIMPNRLGWLTFGLKDEGQNIHSQSMETTHQHELLPRFWLSQLTDLKKYFYKSK